MLIDLKAGNDSWYIWIITNNFVGIAISLIMFSAYPIKEFTRPFYIIWSVLGFFSVIGGYAFWYTHQVGHTMGFWITVPLNIWIVGLHVCKYIEKSFITKEIKSIFSK
jgi:general stress protein CsbA